MITVDGLSDEAVIRRALASESKCLSEIAFLSKAHWGYTTEFMECCRDELTVSEQDIVNQRNHHFVLLLNTQVIGFYVVERKSIDEYELEAMFIEPNSIGCGFGKILIEHAKEFVEENGAISLLIQSDPNAAEFYLAAGGEHVGKRESESIPGRFLPEIRIMLITDR